MTQSIKDSETPQEVVTEKGHKKRRLIALLLLLLLFITAGGGYWYYHTHHAKVKVTVVSGNFLPKGKDASAMKDRELAKYAQKTVDDSKFQMIISPEISINNAKQQSNLYIQNPPNNSFPISVEITLDNGELVYSSGAIKTGYEVKNTMLDKQLKPGKYTGTAMFKLFSPKTSEAKGQVSAVVSIVVT